MEASGHRRWFRAVMLCGAVYVIVGITFAALANTSASVQSRVAWRLAAWFISAVAFAAHVGYEHFRRRSSPRTTAFDASLAVAAFAAAAGLARRTRKT